MTPITNPIIRVRHNTYFPTILSLNSIAILSNKMKKMIIKIISITELTSKVLKKKSPNFSSLS